MRFPVQLSLIVNVLTWARFDFKMDISNSVHAFVFEACRDGEWSVNLQNTLESIGKEVNVKDKFSVTPLHVACWNANVNIVKALLALEDIDVSVLDSFGRTVFHAALLGDKANEYPLCAFVENSLYREERKAYFKKSPFSVEDQLQVIHTLLQEKKIDANKLLDNFSPIYLAVSANESPLILQKVLGSSLISGHGCMEGVVAAVLKDDSQALKLLNESGNELNFNFICPSDLSLLGIAVKRNKVQALQFLLDHPNVDVTCLGRGQIEEEKINLFTLCFTKSLRTRQSRQDCEAVLDILLQHDRVDINQGNSEQEGKPIHHALSKKNPFFLRKLLTHPKIDVNAWHGMFSPLKYAAGAERNCHVDLLLRHGNTDLGMTMDNSMLPAMFDLVQFGTSVIVKKGLAAGGDPNCMGWSDMFNCALNLYEWNILMIPLAKKKEVDDRVKIAEIILHAGVSPFVSSVVWSELEKVRVKNRHKEVISNLVNMSKNVSSLAACARRAIHAQARRITGTKVTLQVLEKLVETEQLPCTVKDFILFERVIK